jgi:hypothetical protein
MEDPTMAVLVTVEGEGSVEDFKAVNEKLDVKNNPPEGLIVHAVVDAGGGRLKSIDVWESAEASQAFFQERLPTAMAEVFGPDAAQPSAPEVQEILDLIQP